MHGSGEQFHLKRNEEEDCNLRLEPVACICSIRLHIYHCKVNDYVTLYNCKDSTCIRKSLCKGGEIQFGYLPSSTYILGIFGIGRTFRLLIPTLPGGSINVYLCLCCGHFYSDSKSCRLLCHSKADQVYCLSKLTKICKCLFLCSFLPCSITSAFRRM